jgi:hypothetical protein
VSEAVHLLGVLFGTGRTVFGHPGGVLLTECVVQGMPIVYFEKIRVLKAGLCR